MIQSACTLVAPSSTDSAGRARYRMVTSSPNSRVGKARTARPIHARRPARGSGAAAACRTHDDMSTSAGKGPTVFPHVDRVTILLFILLQGVISWRAGALPADA